MRRFYLFLAPILMFVACDTGQGPVTQVERTSAGKVLKVVKSEKFWADPAIVKSCEENVVTTMYWKVPDVTTVEVRISDKYGALFAVSGGEGSKQTDTWVKNGMRFFLLDASSKEVIAEANVLIDNSDCN